MGVRSKAAIITAEAGIARAKSPRTVSNAGEVRERNSAGVADEIPFAPFEGFVDGCEMGPRYLSNQVGPGEPLLVGSALELNHGRERIHLVRKAARQRIFRDPVHKFQKWGQPRFHKH